jgi:hypothetical protein
MRFRSCDCESSIGTRCDAVHFAQTHTNGLVRAEQRLRGDSRSITKHPMAVQPLLERPERPSYSSVLLSSASTTIRSCAFPGYTLPYRWP